MGDATTTLVTADGVRLAARWWEPASGNGDAVVVVHGFATHAQVKFTRSLSSLSPSKRPRTTHDVPRS
jgi:alpha-beta hydrolase superfamily lysophospholipase